MWHTLELVETLDWAAERVRIIDQMSPHMLADSNKPYTNAKVTEFHRQLRYFIEGRRTHLTEMLPPPSQP